MASTAWNLIQYKETDPLADAYAEMAALLELPLQQSKDLVSRVLEHYHVKHSDGPPPHVDAATFDLVVHVTSSYRIPSMTERFDWVIERLAGTGPTVLDYGGGGGKDSIIFARLGKQVTYADILNDLTPTIKRRFDLRTLDIPMVDVRTLAEQRFDVINCMDVIEHCYDVEYVTADLLSRLVPGGHLFVWPEFTNSWNGDHVEKNCGYVRYYASMLSRIGFSIAGSDSSVFHVVRQRPIAGPIPMERETIRQELYRLSERMSVRQAMRAAVELPARVAVKAYRGRLRLPLSWAIAEGLSPIIDNLSIWRLSKHRLLEREGRLR